VLWVAKYQRVAKCDLLKDRHSKLVDLHLDILPIYYLIIDHQRNKEVSFVLALRSWWYYRGKLKFWLKRSRIWAPLNTMLQDFQDIIYIHPLSLVQIYRAFRGVEGEIQMKEWICVTKRDQCPSDFKVRHLPMRWVAFCLSGWQYESAWQTVTNVLQLPIFELAQSALFRHNHLFTSHQSNNSGG